MRDKEGDISKKTTPLKNNYKNSLDDIDDGLDISPIPILSSFMMYLLVPPSPLLEKNLAYELVLRITSSSPVRARVTRVKKVY